MNCQTSNSQRKHNNNNNNNNNKFKFKIVIKGKPAMLRNKEKINDRFLIDCAQKLGQGQFAEVFSCIDTRNEEDPRKQGRRYAIKIEQEMKTTKREAQTMRQLTNGRGIPEYVHEGLYVKGGKFMPFIVMQLVGENLADLRTKCAKDFDDDDDDLANNNNNNNNRTPSPSAAKDNNNNNSNNKTFSEITIARIAQQLIDALAWTHEKGYVHRDVKPGNICVGIGSRSERAKCYLIDFGLARRYIDESTGKLIPERDDAQFRGTTTYASANAMNNREQSPRDDLFSLLYILVELYCGYLPWKRTVAVGLDDAEDANYKVMAMNKKMNCQGFPNMLGENATKENRKIIPKALEELSRALTDLKYGEMPDYEKLKCYFLEWEKSLLNGRAATDVRMDWDKEKPAAFVPPAQQHQQQQNNNNNNNNFSIQLPKYNENEELAGRKRERSPEYNLNASAEPFQPTMNQVPMYQQQQQNKRQNINNNNNLATPPAAYDIRPSARAETLIKTLLDNPPLPVSINHVVDSFRNMPPEEIIAAIAATCILVAETADMSRNVDAVDAFLQDARDIIELSRAQLASKAHTNNNQQQQQRFNGRNSNNTPMNRGGAASSQNYNFSDRRGGR